MLQQLSSSRCSTGGQQYCVGRRAKCACPRPKALSGGTCLATHASASMGEQLQGMVGISDVMPLCGHRLAAWQFQLCSTEAAQLGSHALPEPAYIEIVYSLHAGGVWVRVCSGNPANRQQVAQAASAASPQYRRKGM